VLDRPTVLRDEGYVGPERCAECHARNHETWFASYHRTMTQVVTTETVQAPFEGRTPTLEGVAWELGREGERCFAAPVLVSDDPAQPEQRGPAREVVLSTGSHHYQIYWLAAREGLGMDQLPLVWQRGENAWVPRKSLFLKPPEPASLETGRWEAGCIKCHATNGTSEHESGGTRVADFGISCEACHGPAATHVAWHRDPAHAEAETPPEAELAHPRLLPKERSAEVCGQCPRDPPARFGGETRGVVARGLRVPSWRGPRARAPAVARPARGQLGRAERVPRREPGPARRLLLARWRGARLGPRVQRPGRERVLPAR
jgi:hypothetical protein